MKKLIFICVILLSSMLFINAAVKIPQQLKDYIKTNYPKAKGLHWEKHEDTYVARFVYGNKEMALCLDEKAQVLDRLTEITNNGDIPSHILEKINLKRLKHAEKYESRNGELFYLLEVKAPRNQETEIIFDHEGKEITEMIFTNAAGEVESDKVIEF